MNSVMKHSFSNVPKVDIQRSAFDRTSAYKTTFNSGYLIPFFLDEVLPGDTFNVDTTMFARLATPIVPLMDNMYLDTQYFFVPNRLLWSNFQKFMGERTPDPDSSTDYLIPTLPRPAGTGFVVGTLADYFGLPTGVVGVNGFSVNSLPFRMYNLIWNEWYRDQNIQDSVVVDLGDGPDDISDYVLLRRGKRHDYFTSCLPWPQIGPSIPLPLTGDIAITGIGKGTQSYSDYTNKAVYTTDGSGTVVFAKASAANGTADNSIFVEEDPNNTGYPNIRGDLSSVTAATINELRQAFQLQRMAERDARGGTRYVEILRAHFSVVSPDARLQRPEFLASSSHAININPVQQTSESADTPQGNLAAYGLVTGRNGFTKSFVEHGYVIGLLSVRADLTYQQGVDRMWSRRTKYDIYWPALAHLGEQAVPVSEIYIKGVTATDATIFGYQERFAEYRYKRSLITGELRSTFAQSLDVWHLSQEFTDYPTLSSTFIQDNPPIDRVIAVTSPVSPQFILDCFIKNRTVRPMPTYSVPGNIDRF